MRELITEINLNASADKVWRVLIDFEAYPQWNPFIISIEGELKVGNQLTTKMLNNGKSMTFKPIVTKLEHGRQFEWLGSAFLGGFKGRHYFILESLGDGQTKLLHGEKFSGWMSGLILKKIEKDTLNGFQAMNQALQKKLMS